MLQLVIVAVTCQLTIAAGFLDDCPVDGNVQIDELPVRSILETFYRDLKFVRSSTGSRQLHNFAGLEAEIEDIMNEDIVNDHSEDPTLEHTLDEAKRLFTEVIRLLDERNFTEAKALLKRSKSDLYSSGWKMTYFEYLQAESYKLAGNNEEASESVLLTYIERHISRGISMNELERLDGLLALQKVSQFNRHVDRLYGLRESPNYQLLLLAHSLFKDEIEPLSKIRSAIFDRSVWTASPKHPSGSDSSTTPIRDVQRVDPDLDEFDGQSVADTSAESILCEFARKLSTLAPTLDNGDVLGQLKELDASFAEELDDKVVKLIDTDIESAKGVVCGMWVDMIYQTPSEGDAIRASFVGYFYMEVYRRSMGRCNLWSLNFLQEDMDTIKWLRQHYKGVSLGKLAELEAKFVAQWLICFHERVRLAYELDGNEDEQQLDTRRSRWGASIRRTLPESDMLRAEELIDNRQSES